jgi:hypothetical protein
MACGAGGVRHLPAILDVFRGGEERLEVIRDGRRVRALLRSAFAGDEE